MDDLGWQRMSVEEYLRTEPDSPVKREYVGGFVYALNNSEAMRGDAGSSRAHADITLNIVGVVRPVARRQGCRAYASDVRLRIEGHNTYYYPDVMVACGPDAGDPYAEFAPSLLVEVLSRGTTHIDRHAKYEAYISLPSLQAYLIVAQDERRVYAYTRQGGEWVLKNHIGDGEVELPFLGINLTLDDIYDGVLDA